MATAITFGTGQSVISGTWSDVEAIALAKHLAIQYVEPPGQYQIFALDGPLVYTCMIWKGTVPDGVVNGGYSQAQNDTDKSDFETNYKANANSPVDSLTAKIIDGYVTTVGTTNTAIMASSYTEQTSNAQRSLVSSDTNDTSAGTGARTVKITYYDQNLNGPFYETVTLNGTSAVNTTSTTICYVESLCVQTVGANGGNAGTISLKASTGGGGATIGSIVTGDNETNWCHHYIPIGRTMRLTQIIGNIKGAYSGIIRVRKFQPTVANSSDTVIAPALRVPSGGQDDLVFATPLAISGPAKVILYAQADGGSTTNNQDWIAGFMYFES